jgi:hypothetical protein
MPVSEQTSRLVSSAGLVIGSVLGMAGTFVPSAQLRGLLWGLDGVVLTVAASLLAIHHLRKGNDVIAAGFLVFVLGQTLVLSSAASGLAASGPTFGAGASLWAASLFLLSFPRVATRWVRITGVISGLTFAVVALQLFMGSALTPLSQPLPFFAYPLFVATLLGWAWERFRSAA